MNYTERELQEIINRREDDIRGGALIAMCLAALSGAVMGALIVWWLK